MPEKQVRVNNKGYLLSYGNGQEEQLDRLIELIEQRIKPYAERFAEYSEGYLLLLVLLEFADELDGISADNSRRLSSVQEDRLKMLAQQAKILVKRVQSC